MPATTPRARNHGWRWAILIGLGLMVALLCFWEGYHTRPLTLRLCAGDTLGRRYRVAQILAAEGAHYDLNLQLEPAQGSVEALSRVARGECDLALIQGGLEPPPHVVQVAGLVPEPLHLLVKPELAEKGLDGLQHKRLNLSTIGSGTRKLSLEVLEFARFQPVTRRLEAGVDFTDAALPYEDLERLPYNQLPDGVFMVSLLPSPVAEFLVKKHGYRLMEIPFGEAMSLRDNSVQSAVIPEFAYSVNPPIPPRTLRTVGTRLLLVANERVSSDAIERVLETLLGGGVSRKANLPALHESEIAQNPEMPMHPGTLAYLKRNDPALTSETIQRIENLRSFFASMGVVLYVAWRWWLRRRSLGFDKYLTEVTRIEQEALQLEREPTLNLEKLMESRYRVSQLKNEALVKFAEGSLKGEELMANFLAHITDVRNYLNTLILYERDRLEEQNPNPKMEAKREALFEEAWREAVAPVPPQNTPEAPKKGKREEGRGKREKQNPPAPTFGEQGDSGG